MAEEEVTRVNQEEARPLHPHQIQTTFLVLLEDLGIIMVP